MFTGRVTGVLDGALPSWPALSSPQAHTVPSVPRTVANPPLAKVPPGPRRPTNPPPAEMPAMDTGSPDTRSGVERLVSVPSPSCPRSLPPQVHTEVIAEMPLARVAMDASKPAEIPVTPDKPATLTGSGLLAVVPLPSWPRRLSPQARTVPSDRSASTKLPPAEILVTRASPRTRAGVTS